MKNHAYVKSQENWMLMDKIYQKEGSEVNKGSAKKSKRNPLHLQEMKLIQFNDEQL